MYAGNNSNDNKFLNKLGGQEEVAQYFSSAEKGQWTQNPIPGGKYPPEMKGKSKYSEIKKTERICCQQNVSKGITKGSSLNKMEIIKETLQYQEEKKNMVSKNMCKCKRLSFSSWVLNCLMVKAKLVKMFVWF